MSRSLARLHRTIPGERHHGLPPLILRIEGRGVARAMVLRTRPEVHAPLGPVTRELRVTVRPEPNAPLLIRVVKIPYRMSTGWAVRVPGRDALPALAPIRLPRLAAEARDALRREPPLQPGRGRPRPTCPPAPRGLVGLLVPAEGAP